MTQQDTRPPAETLAEAREAAALAFDARARKASHPEVVTLERHYAKVIRAGEGDEYDAVQAAVIALTRRAGGDDAEREALAGYRAAVSFVAADSWDGCSDCIETLKAARVADWQNDQAADPNETARQLARIRAHRRPVESHAGGDAIPAGDQYSSGYAQGQADADQLNRWMQDKAWQDTVLMLVHYQTLAERTWLVGHEVAVAKLAEWWGRARNLSETKSVEDIAATPKPPAGGDAGAVEGFVLFYRPPCGKWYVHSHKIYLTADDAQAAADRFLHPKTPVAIRAVAALALPAPVVEGERWRHVKRGTVYEVIGYAELQNGNAKGLHEGAELAVYRGEDGKLWARERGEFHDGRFAALSEGRSHG